MATVAHVRKALAGYAGDEVQIIEWGLLTTTNLDGEWIALPLHRDISIHCYGTFGAGATVTIQGSNEVVASPTAPVTVNSADAAGTAPYPLTFTTAGGAAIRQVLDAPVKIRPLLSGGDGTTSLTVVLKAVRSRG
jgi:hypothetical protein